MEIVLSIFPLSQHIGYKSLTCSSHVLSWKKLSRRYTIDGPVCDYSTCSCPWLSFSDSIPTSCSFFRSSLFFSSWKICRKSVSVIGVTVHSLQALSLNLTANTTRWTGQELWLRQWELRLRRFILQIWRRSLFQLHLIFPASLHWIRLRNYFLDVRPILMPQQLIHMLP